MNNKPVLRNISLKNKVIDQNTYPYKIPAYKNGIDIEIKSNVTFFIGANGSGKSTLLEAIADICGFNLIGGNKNHNYIGNDNISQLSSNLKLSWTVKTTNGFFLRAETFYNFSNYIDELDPRGKSDYILNPEGKRSVHDQSHGESFLSLFSNKFRNGIYILDEPEAALSPNSQLSFMSIMNNLINNNNSQFIIATHSPMLLCFPNAIIYELNENGFAQIEYHEAEHYKLTKDFLNNPERYFKYLFQD
jgi:predicted ATPase